MTPDSFFSRARIALALCCIAASGACVAAGSLAADGVRASTSGGQALNAAPAASAASAPRVSPYILAARRHAAEAASEPLKVNPLMQHRPRVPRAANRAQ